MALTALVVSAVFLSTRAMLAFAIGAGVVAFVAVLLLLFSTMTVVVDDTAVEARFGIGVIRKRIPFDRIRSCQVVRNPWYYGWGIHFIPGGILYNASGLSAIELQLTDGRSIRFGSGEPDVLAATIRRMVPETGQGATEEIEFSSARNMVIAVPLIIAPVFALVAMMIYAGMRPPEVHVTAGSFTVSNGMYSNTIPIKGIRSASLDEQLPRVRGKTNGFAVGETLRGSFSVDSWGSARLYVNLNHPPFIVIRSDDGFVAVNFANPHQTRDMYTQLRQALDR